jgi:hypothetical protein
MALADGKSFVNSIIAILASFITAVVTLVIYRIVYNCYFHPLSAFPGPRLAAITSLYLAYVDFVANGSLVRVLQNLHDKYGKASCNVQIPAFNCPPWNLY